MMMPASNVHGQAGQSAPRLPGLVHAPDSRIFRRLVRFLTPARARGASTVGHGHRPGQAGFIVTAAMVAGQGNGKGLPFNIAGLGIGASSVQARGMSMT
jgi:hypothetical protein